MKIIKKILGEIVLFLVLLFIIVITVILLLASIIMVFTNRRSLKEYWRDIGALVKRLWLHYRCVFYDLKEGLKKLKPTKTERPIARSDSYSRVVVSTPTWYADNVDPFAIVLITLHLINLSFYIAVLINIAYLAITLVVVYHDPVVETKPISVPKVEYEFIPTQADKQEKDYGPWTEAYNLPRKTIQDPSFLNFALIDEVGEIKFSDRFRADFTKSGFTPKDHMWVQSPRLNKSGRIQFEDRNGNTHEVNAFQAFQFLDEINLTLAFDKSGNLHQIKTSELITIEIKKEDKS